MRELFQSTTQSHLPNIILRSKWKWLEYYNCKMLLAGNSYAEQINIYWHKELIKLY